jgi:hypothetical protein
MCLAGKQLVINLSPSIVLACPEAATVKNKSLEQQA